MLNPRIHDDVRPCLQWLTATTLAVTPQRAPGIEQLQFLTGPDGWATVTMRSGRRFQYFQLVLDETVVGEGGMLAAPPAGVSTWHYVYLVPSLRDPTQLAIIAATQQPPAGLTALGYPEWLYCGAVLWDDVNTTFIPFRYLGHGHMRYTYPLPVDTQAAGADAVAVAVNPAGAGILAVPAVTYAAELKFGSGLTIGMGTGVEYHIWAAIDNGITAPTWAEHGVLIMVTNGEQVATELVIPVPPTGNQPWVWYQRVDIAAGGSTATSDISCGGFFDPYLV